MDENKLKTGDGRQESGLLYVCEHKRYLFNPMTVFSFKHTDTF